MNNTNTNPKNNRAICEDFPEDNTCNHFTVEWPFKIQEDFTPLKIEKVGNEYRVALTGKTATAAHVWFQTKEEAVKFYKFNKERIKRLTPEHVSIDE